MSRRVTRLVLIPLAAVWLALSPHHAPARADQAQHDAIGKARPQEPRAHHPARTKRPPPTTSTVSSATPIPRAERPSLLEVVQAKLKRIRPLTWAGVATLIVMAILLWTSSRRKRAIEDLERQLVALKALQANAGQSREPAPPVSTWPHQTSRSNNEAIGVFEDSEDLDDDVPVDEDDIPLDDDVVDWYARQIETLDAATARNPNHLHRRPVLNKQEKAIFEICLAWASARHLRIMPQTNMGVFVRTRRFDPNASDVHRTYNSKRVDFLICSESWWPRMVVEHQGGGHGQGDADGRFAVKQRVFDLTLLPLVETLDDEPPESVQAKLDAAWEGARHTNRHYWNQRPRKVRSKSRKA